MEIAEGTAIVEHQKVRGGVHALIEDPNGPIRRQVARSVDDLISRMPTPDETNHLRLSSGIPVIRVLRTVYDPDDRPLEVQDTVAAADSHQFRYEVQMSDDPKHH
jgi:GntR family transcriptional regulator